MKKILISIVFLLLAIGLSNCTELKRAKVIIPPSLIGMKKVTSTLYVEKSMDKIKIKKIKEAIPKANRYVSDIYGEVMTTPTIYACQSEACAKSLGLDGKMIAVRLLGHLLLTEKGINKEIISHEWSHEELYERIGGFYHWYKEIPSWFDEGLASLTMQKYSRHDESAWEKIKNDNIPYPKKNELLTSSQWSKAIHEYLNNDDIAVPYAVARHMVSQWYRKVGQEGLLKLLDGIKKGKKFEELYDRADENIQE